jgi:ubiquinol-cytochrome c reductase cytochrome b subunit
VFIGSIVVHMGRVFFTGAFRKPRETNWIIGTALLTLAILNGFIGYSLPDDLISGTGLRIGYSILESIPLVGSYLAFFLFGGNFPGGNDVLPRFFLLHILILPALIAGLVGAHLAMLVRQKHTQFPGGGRTEHNVVGSPMFPTFMAKTTGFLFMTAGALALLGGLAQINPIWQFGSYQADKISYAVQPDWYMGWLDGALRIMPSWETTFAGHTIPWEVFFPAIIFPGIIFTLAGLAPMIEKKVSGDDSIHNLLERPRDRPKRTAYGAAFFTLLAVLFAASSTDVLANYFNVSLNLVLWFFRIAVFVIPVLVGLVTWRICLEMQHGGHGMGQRKRAVIMSRTATGEYTTVTAPPRPDDDHHEPEPVQVPLKIDLDAETVGSSASGPGVRQVTR